MTNRVISNTVSHLEVFQCERINTEKQKDGLTSFLMLSVLEVKIFLYGFLEEHEVYVNNHNINYWSSTKRNDQILSLGMAIKILYLGEACMQPCKRKGLNWPFLCFSGCLL